MNELNNHCGKGSQAVAQNAQPFASGNVVMNSVDIKTEWELEVQVRLTAEVTGFLQMIDMRVNVPSPAEGDANGASVPSGGIKFLIIIKSIFNLNCFSFLEHPQNAHLLLAECLERVLGPAY